MVHTRVDRKTGSLYKTEKKSAQVKYIYKKKKKKCSYDHDKPQLCKIYLYVAGGPYCGGGGDLVSIMPVCVCPKMNEMGSFSASSE